MVRSNVKRWFSSTILIFSLLMLVKSFLAWFVLFENGPSWTTWLKELPFALVIFCLIEWFAGKRKLLLYCIANLLITGIYFAVIMYYKYYGVIVTYHALEQVNQVTAVSNSVISLLDPQYLLIFADCVVLLVLLFRGRKAVNWTQFFTRTVNRKIVAVLFGLSISLCLAYIYPNRASMNEIVKAEQMGILNYEAYTLFGEPEPEAVQPEQITQASIRELKGISEQLNPFYQGAAAGKNVILIQMESMQDFLIDLTIDGQEITPTMNRLVRENFYFTHFYQQVGQGNTSDAEFVVNTSFYIPRKGAAVQVYGGKQLPSLPKLLKEHGYQSATFHTNVVEFWNRGELYQALGFDRYYDKSYFGEDDSVFFGASDDVLYAKTADELETMDRQDHPFYAHIISMTAHHPFTIPERKHRMSLPERYDGTFVGDYIQAQNYADAALGQFIDDLKQRGIWENSIVVLYGDHLGLPLYSLDNDDKKLLQEIFGRKYTYTDMIHIPMVIASPGVTYPAEWDQLGGQIDVLPTVANLLGASLENHIHFGQDLLNQNTYNLLPQRYYLPTGSFVSSKELFLSGSGYEDGTNYPLAGDGTDMPQATEAEFQRALDLLHLSDSYVSQLPDRE